MNTAALLPRIFFCAAAFLCSSAALASNAAQPLPIQVVDVAGEVDVTTRGKAQTVEPSDTLELPSRIETGGHGRLGIAQAATTISIGPNSDVEIPETAAAGQLIARLVQYRGSVFYDVAPRGVDKLRIETPLLVAVVKGTQFNVAVQDDRTTISLFEGLLEIRTPEGDQVAELRAGEIAIRARGDDAIRIVRMDQERPAEPQAARDGAAQGTVAAAAVRPLAADDLLTVGAAGGAVDADFAVRVDRAEVALAGDTANALSLSIGDAADGGLAGAASAPLVDLGGGASLEMGGSLGGTGADLGLVASLSLDGGGFGAAVDASVDLGVVSADASAGTAIDLGAGTVSADLGATGALAGIDAGVDVGAAIDLGGGAIAADLGAGADLGGLDTGLDLGAALDADVGALDAGADAGASIGGVDAGATIDAGLDGGGLAIDTGLDVGGLDVGLNAGLGSGGIDLDVDLGGSGGGLLDGGSGLLGGGGLL